MDLKTSSISEISDPYIPSSKSTDLIKPKDALEKEASSTAPNNEGNNKSLCISAEICCDRRGKLKEGERVGSKC